MSAPGLPLEAAPPGADHGSGRLPLLDDRRRGTKFVRLVARSVLNSPESTGMGFWSLNPYVGCEFGCTYCYARYAHRYVVERAHRNGHLSDSDLPEYRGPTGWEAFENRIFVKARASVLTALGRDLGRVRLRMQREGRQNITIGTATDPYQPAERQYQITRAVLERLCAERGLRIGIITKSTLIGRDIDVLRRLSRRNPLSVYVSLISTDPTVVKEFEERSPMPHARLRTLRKLSDAGIRAGLIVAPVLPGVTDSVEQVTALMACARDAGAKFVFPVPLRLYPAVREPLLPVLERRNPALAARYRKAFVKWSAPTEYVTAMKRRFRTIAERFGIPATDAEQEQPKEGVDRQLSLW